MIVQRRELLERMNVRLDHRVTYHHLELTLAALEAEIVEALKAGDEVRLIGFGTFGTRKRAASSAPKHAPGTGGPAAAKRVRVPAHRVARFVPGTRLRASVRKSR